MANTKQVDTVMTDTVLNEIIKGRKVQAIKLLRQESGLGLAEAKDLVEEYVESNPQAKEAFETNKTTGVSQESVLRIVLVSIVLIVAYSLFWK